MRVLKEEQKKRPKIRRFLSVASDCTGWSMEGPGQTVLNRPTNPGRKADKWTESGFFFFFFFLDFFKVPRPNSDSKTPNSPSGLGTKLVNLEVLQVLI